MRGIEAARVNPANFKLTVVHDVAIGEIQRSVAGLGYEAWPEARKRPTEEPPPFWRARVGKLATVISGIALLAAWLLARTTGEGALVGLLYFLAALVGGAATFRKGLLALRAGTFDMNALMLIGVSGAFAIGAHAEGSSVAFLYAVSNLLEAATRARTRTAIQALVALAPKQAVVVRDGKEQPMPVEAIEVGDVLVIPPGGRLAMDGVVETGTSVVDQAPITGESIPVRKAPGDPVFAGSINGAGALLVTVTRLAEDTTLQKIIEMVEEAQGERAPVQDAVDRFARWYTPAVLVAALLVATLPPLLLGWPWVAWIYRALSLIVFACPCALVVSTPVALAAGIGNAARHGVLIKGGVFLEQAASIRAWAFDKTGTLTAGRPVVQEVFPLADHSTDEVLRLAAAVEARSEHPLGAAIMARAAGLGLALPAADACEAIVGSGACARVGGELAYVASPRFFAEQGLLPPAVRELIEDQQAIGRTAVVVGNATAALGVITLADPVRPEAAGMVARLRRLGVAHVAMLTGDNALAAAAVGRQVGVDQVLPELLPQDKVKAVRQFAERHGKTAMVGDGINDAPALASAHLGVAMGAAGTDVAIETANVALMGDETTGIPFLIRLSQATHRIIVQNITFSLAVKLVALVAVFPGWLTLWMAVLGDMGATILVTLNALRLLALRPEPIVDAAR